MHTGKAGFRWVILFGLLGACISSAPAASVYYYFNFGARGSYPAQTILVEVDRYLDVDDGWVPILNHVEVYDQVFTQIRYVPSGNQISLAFLTMFFLNPAGYILRPQNDISSYPVGTNVQIEARLDSPALQNQTYGLSTTQVYYRSNVLRPFQALTALPVTGDQLLVTDQGPTLVTMTGMWAEARGRAVLVYWETASEVGTAGFQILRAEQGEPFEVVSESLIPGDGGGTFGAAYSWTDTKVEAGRTYSYIIQEVEDTGHTNEYGPVSAIVREPRSEPRPRRR